MSSVFQGVDARYLLIEQEGTSDTEGVYGIQWGCGNLGQKSGHRPSRVGGKSLMPSIQRSCG